MPGRALWAVVQCLCSLSHPHLGEVDEHCQAGREPFPGSVPWCGWVAGSSAHCKQCQGAVQAGESWAALWLGLCWLFYPV